LCISAAGAADGPSTTSVQSAAERATAYARGQGVVADKRKAALMFCEAARSDDVDSVFTLAWMYANGLGVPRDPGAASALFKRAEALGHPHAASLREVLGEAPKSLPDCLVADDWSAARAIAALDRLDEYAKRQQATPDLFDAMLAALPTSRKAVADIVTRLAPAYQIEPKLALALIRVESNFEPLAQSVKDARGVMQLTAATAARFNVKNAWDVQQNVRGGLAYLRWLLAYYEGRIELAMAAYNAGEGAVDRYGGIPPYPETREYVRRVQKLFTGNRHPYDSRIVGASPILAHLEKTK
jgi:hypothetical protein